MRSKPLYAFLLLTSPVLSCFVLSPSLLSQAPSQPAVVAGLSNSTHAPDPDSGMTGHVDGLFIPLVTGHPFHAKITVTVQRILGDGTVVDQKYYTLAARDANGREYRESRDILPADS